jgi:hypothetical protein
MDPLTNVITSLVGTIVGAVGGFLQAKQEVEKRKVELAAEQARMAHEEKMATLNADIETQKGEAAAFVESQKSGATDRLEIPANAHWLVQTIVAVVAAFRTATRPGITWYLVIGARYEPNLMPLASTAVGWWFGVRGGRYFNK